MVGDSINVAVSPYSSYSDGAATSVGHVRSNVPLRERLLNTPNLTSDQEAMLKSVMNVAEVDSVLDTDTDVYQWPAVLRGVSTNNGLTEYQHTNSSSDYERMIFSAKHIGGTLEDLFYNMHPALSGDKMLVAADPRVSGMGAKAYAPALPTANLTDMLRGVSQALGLPIIDTFKHLVMFDGYQELKSPVFSDFQVKADSPDTAQPEVILTWYETKIETGPFVIYKSTDVISIESDQTTEVVVQMTGTPKDLDDTVIAVGAIPFSGGEPNVTESMVCVTGSDGYIVSPSRWNDLGGSVLVRRGVGPFDLILTITGPADKGSSPFTLTEGADRPALYIVANGGISFVQRTVKLGLSEARAKPWHGDDTYQAAQADASTIEMLYVDTLSRAYSALVRHAGVLTGPNLTCAGTLPVHEVEGRYIAAGVSVPTLPAKKFYLEHNMWRITDAQWAVDSATVNVSATAGITCDDFNTNYSHAKYNVTADKYAVDSTYLMTFNDFNSAMTRSGIKTFGDFNVAPLIVRPEGL